MGIEWHAEDCFERNCHGECHQEWLECDDCGMDYVYEAGEEKAHVGTSCTEEECEGTIDYRDGSDYDGRAAERRQMGLINF